MVLHTHTEIMRGGMMPKVGGFNAFVCKLEGKPVSVHKEIDTSQFSFVNVTNNDNFFACLLNSYEHGYVSPEELDRGIEWSTVSPEFERHADALFEDEPDTDSGIYIVNTLSDMYDFMYSGGLIGGLSFEDYRRWNDA